MNMTIKEKIDNFRELLKHSYQAQKKENLVISLEILKSNGLDIRELKDVICPSLVAEGILRQQPSFLINSDHTEERLREDAFEKINEIEKIKRSIARTRATDKIQEEINLDAIGRLDDMAKSYIEQVPSYEFTVNKDTLNKNSNNAPAQKIDTVDGKMGVIIDLQKGIYAAAYPDRIYEISGKRKNVVKYLCENSVASLSDLIACTGQANSLMVKEIKEINDNFKNHLGVEKGLIVHSKTAGGYRLNKDDFNIKTPT